MFPDVHVGARVLIHPVGLEAGKGHVLTVDTPADAPSVEQVDHGLDVLVDLPEGVEQDAVGVGTQGGDIVGLRGVGDGLVVVQLDAQGGEILEVGIAVCHVVVLVLEEDLDEAVEGLALDIAGRVQRQGGCCGGVHVAGGGGRVHVGRRRRRLRGAHGEGGDGGDGDDGDT